MSESRPDERYGDIAAVLAHPDDESFGCAGALALEHDADRAVRLLEATRGEAGTPDGVPDEELAARVTELAEKWGGEKDELDAVEVEVDDELVDAD